MCYNQKEFDDSEYDGYQDCTFMSENTLYSLYNEVYNKLERKYKNERN